MGLSEKRRGAKGAVLVELAVALPILVLVVWGIIDFARAYYTANSLTSAVREGARYAVVFGDPSSKDSLIKVKVKETFTAFGGDSIVTDSIKIIDEHTTTGKVTVEVKGYTWTASNPLSGIFTNGKIIMTRRATFRWEAFDESGS